MRQNDRLCISSASGFHKPEVRHPRRKDAHSPVVVGAELHVCCTHMQGLQLCALGPQLFTMMFPYERCRCVRVAPCSDDGNVSQVRSDRSLLARLLCMHWLYFLTLLELPLP